MNRRPSTIQVGHIELNRVGFGSFRVLGPRLFGPPADRSHAIRVIQHAYESGANFIDTADCYGPEEAERLVAEAFSPYASDVFVATKGGQSCSYPGVWRSAGQPTQLQESCRQSLLRLKRDSIQLYQLHTVDPHVPIEDSVGALENLRRDGLIEQIGLCNVSVDELIRARTISPISSVQCRFNLFEREHEDVLRFCDAHGIVFIPWYPLANWRMDSAKLKKVEEIATAINATVSQVAIAWLLARSNYVVPIPGSNSLAHVSENCAALSLPLDDSALTHLEAIE